MKTVIDELLRYQDMEQVLGNTTPVNKFCETHMQFS